MVASLLRMMYQAATGRYEPYGDMREADCVIGQAFGLSRCEVCHSGFEPGVVNEDLVCYLSDNFSVSTPVFLQDELVMEMSVAGANAWKSPIVAVGRIGTRISTRGILKNELMMAYQNGFRRFAILAQAHHVPRCYAVASRLIEGHDDVELIVPPGLPRSFDRMSEQWWTRSRWQWIAKEWLVIMHHKFEGWI